MSSEREHPRDFELLSGHEWWSTVQRTTPERVEYVSHGMGNTRPYRCHRRWCDARDDIVADLERQREYLDRELAIVRGDIARVSQMHAPEAS